MRQKARTLIRYCENYLSFIYFHLFISRRRPKTFTFNGRIYEYLNHVYNTTWRNERTIEVPIVWNEVNEIRGEILEVGNVLSHYYPTLHDVVDLDEKAPRVINEDIRTYNPQKKYELISCISTLEHVGGKTEILDAFNNLRRLLKQNGRILITIPIGLNPDLDKILRSGMLPFTRTSLMVRHSDLNLWEESAKSDCLFAKFDFKVPRANVVLIGEYLDRPLL